MKFGHATIDALPQVDFTLPADHLLSWVAEEKTKDVDEFSIYVGCGKWGIKEWVGSVYPEKTRIKDFLPAYINTFNAIELNGTFYRLSRSSIAKWSEAANGTTFQFCPKWSQRISHFGRLYEVDENIEYFITSMEGLGDNLGCTFLTLPPNFGPKHLNRVHDFIGKVPQDYPIAVEFRHKDWYTDDVFSEVVSAMKDRGLTLCLTDVALRRDALHMCLTNNRAFVRFNGYGLHESDFTRLDEWVPRIVDWRKAGVQEVYFFMHQSNEAHTPVLVDYFSQKVNAQLGMDLPVLNLPSS